MGNQSNSSVTKGGTVGGVVGAVGLVIADCLIQETAVATAGSIFWFATQAATVFGVSTEVTAIGLSTATIVGGAVIIASIAIGCAIAYYVYTRRRQVNGTEVIDQTVSSQPVSNVNILSNHQPIELPEFKPIKMTARKFQQVYSLTQGEFAQVVKDITCPYSMQVMRYPCRMKCCKHLGKFAEKSFILNELHNHGRCINCKKEAVVQDIQRDVTRQCTIDGFRRKLVKVYKNATQDQKNKWKILIDQQMGNGYTQNHLENFQFSAQS